EAIEEYDYTGSYLPAYPIKVNQNCHIVDELLRAGRKYNLCLEIGSKTEFLAALSFEQKPGALLICNGFKDTEYIENAVLGMRLGKRVVLVVEKVYEVDLIIEKLRDLPPALRPAIGLRLRLAARGSGRWGRAGGSTSKFGLTTLELLQCIEKLKNAGMLGLVEMLHCHNGSQITEIRKIKNVMREMARIYAKVRKNGIKIKYLNVGGGLGVDYDGSRTSSDSSVNYSMQEFANDVVYTIHTVCESEEVEAPIIVTETGRALTAYHAILVTNVITEIHGDTPAVTATEEDPLVVQELAELRDEITIKNFREFYHDALHQREELLSMFNLGYLDLESRAKGESLFWEICRKSVTYARRQKFVPEEFEALERHLAKKYVCNFSIFQSLPDHWAIEQLFPIMPIHRLTEMPTEAASLVDLTCDSDGEIDNFVDLKDIKKTLAVHPLDGNPYYLAILLVGAYQDTMGNFHNLFGKVNEAYVIIDERKQVHIQRIVRGDSAAEVTAHFGYDRDTMLRRVRAQIERLGLEGEARTEMEHCLALYRKQLDHSPYLREGTGA
ncbi:MAG: biosynthetic arginine decarboxylase, partial [Deltaproteobacteria bacterium]